MLQRSMAQTDDEEKNVDSIKEELEKKQAKTGRAKVEPERDGSAEGGTAHAPVMESVVPDEDGQSATRAHARTRTGKRHLTPWPWPCA